MPIKKQLQPLQKKPVVKPEPEPAKWVRKNFPLKVGKAETPLSRKKIKSVVRPMLEPIGRRRRRREQPLPPRPTRRVLRRRL